LLRRQLVGSNTLKREHVHALIGRSIFIRYLEDREVLRPEYFIEVIGHSEYHNYMDFLINKPDTYFLFRKLREDFNGDLFPLNPDEESVIQETDLSLLRDFLLGRNIGAQLDLFFWAYQFDIIPVELISSIYEEFYYEYGDEDGGTHYTPLPLVEFILSQCLTEKRLATNARILDPACGSGVFLVEAFKRIVNFECSRRGLHTNRLPKSELTQILLERIVGIDINKQAIQIAAFSLYLAFLDSLDPPDIRQHKQLPKLVHHPEQENSGKTLFYIDVFSPTSTERALLKERTQKSRYKGKSDDIRLLGQSLLPLENESFDIIIGNPPWGDSDSSNDKLATLWCKVFGFPVGYNELSQCFIWRTQSLVKPSGEIGMLVSTGILLKNGNKSKDFRKQWLTHNKIRAIYNFAHVRHVFFRKQKVEAIAPFAAVFFLHDDSVDVLQNKVSYISIKRSVFAEQLQSVVIDKTDLHISRQSEFLVKDWLWKTYMWGGQKDVELIEEIKAIYPPLRNFVSDSGRGFSDFEGNHSTDELEVNYEMPNERFSKALSISQLVIPIQRRSIGPLRKLGIYKGDRILIKRGISRGGEKNGEIQARLFHENFAFTDSFIGIVVDTLDENQRLILMGIILSSLTKYYQFLTCSMWGLWHYKIHVEEYLDMPIVFPENQNLQTRIIQAVTAIAYDKDNVFLKFDTDNWHSLQAELDNAIFELYELSNEQKDLVSDLCQVTLDFFYDGAKSQAVRSPSPRQLEEYRDAFLDVWNDRLLQKSKQLQPLIFAPNNGLLCGMAFELKELGDISQYPPITDDAEWQRWFRRLSRGLLSQYSQQIYTDRVVKELTNSSMFIIKRAESRLWTKSQARQDANEFLTQVFKLEWRSNSDNRGIL